MVRDSFMGSRVSPHTVSPSTSSVERRSSNRLVSNRRAHSPQKPKSPGPWTKLILPAVFSLLAIGSTYGVAFVDKPESCPVYINRIGDLVKDGWEFESFVAIDDGRTEVRCGEAHDIARTWLETLNKLENENTQSNQSDN